MNKLPKEFKEKVDMLRLLGVGYTAQLEVADLMEEYAKYRLEEFIADHFPEDSPKKASSLTEKDCKELDDCLGDMFRKAYKTGINIPKEDELPKPPLKSKFEIDQPIFVELEIDGKIYKLPEGFIKHFTE